MSFFVDSMFTNETIQSGLIVNQLNTIGNFDEWIKSWDSLLAIQLGNDLNSGFENIMMELESGIAKNHQLYQPSLSMSLPTPIKQEFSLPLSTLSTGQMDHRVDSGFEAAEKVCTVIPESAFKRVEDNGKSMYHCTWENCDRKFTRRSANCRAHWLKHKKVASFVCLTCSLGFKRSVDLARHKLTYHYTSIRLH
jgi:hypothetical protein